MTINRNRIAAALGAAALLVATGTPLAAAAPSATGSSPVDHLGRPTPAVQVSLLSVADNPAIPAPLAQGIRAAVNFFSGDGAGGPDLPDNAPRFDQFLWPTAAQRCIDGTQQAVATAIAVPGPAALPLPGVPEGHTGFVFTVLGTGTVSPQQSEPLLVHWVNLSTGATGVTPLEFHGINPDGPATVNATAPTGNGLVAAAITGAVTTTENGRTSTCRFIPTVGFTELRHHASHAH